MTNALIGTASKASQSVMLTRQTMICAFCFDILKSKRYISSTSPGADDPDHGFRNSARFPFPFPFPCLLHMAFQNMSIKTQHLL